jgi:hypothetical protein
MQIEQYFQDLGDNKLQFSRQHASDFAKDIANDYNPIHDVDTKRFCVPGDLLFSVCLAKTGINKTMSVNFADMVADSVELTLAHDANEEKMLDNKGKLLLSVQRDGSHSDDPTLVSELSQAYVAHSGKTFPHILVPLMRQHNPMINPARPLVIYQSAKIELEHFDFKQPSLRESLSSMDVNGKRGNVTSGFEIVADGQVVGRGEKCMVLSGLREFEEGAMQGIVDYYNDRKATMSK